MRRSKDLEVLFPGLRAGILSATYLEPSRWWSLGDLAFQLEVSPPRLRRDLMSLSAGGVLRSRRAGNRTFFQANGEFALFAELKDLVVKTAGRAARNDGSETILVVEDQPATLKISRILLESWGYRVLEANTAQEAIQMFERNRAAVKLLLTDVVMPDMSGLELAERLRTIEPALRVLFMSGYHSEELAAKESAFLSKPFNPASLAKKVREELDKT